MSDYILYHLFSYRLLSYYLLVGNKQLYCLKAVVRNLPLYLPSLCQLFINLYQSQTPWNNKSNRQLHSLKMALSNIDSLLFRSLPLFLPILLKGSCSLNIWLRFLLVVAVQNFWCRDLSNWFWFFRLFRQGSKSNFQYMDYLLIW